MADTFIDNLDWITDELITSTKFNQWWANMQNFHNGTALGDGIIVTRHIPNGEIGAAKRKEVVGSGVLSTATLGTTGNKVVTGLGFQPKAVFFEVLPTDNATIHLHGRGFMSTAAQYAIGGASSGSQSNRVSSSSNCIGWSSAGNGLGVWSLLGSRVSLDADGFTINLSIASNAFPIAWVAIA